MSQDREERVNLAASVPAELFWAFKEDLARRRMSQTESVTRLLCAHLGRDVAEFGLEPLDGHAARRRPARAAV